MAQRSRPPGPPGRQLWAIEPATRPSPDRALTPAGSYGRLTAVPARADCLGTDELDGSLIVTVQASCNATLASIRQLDLTRPVDGALRALDLDHRFALVPTRLDREGARPLRIGGIWRIDDAAPEKRAASAEFDTFAAPGHIKVSWEIDVTPGEQDTALAIKTRFTTTDGAANERLLGAWAIVGPLNDLLTRRTAHTVKRYAEDLEDDQQVGWP